MHQLYLQLGTHQLRSVCFGVELRADLLDSLITVIPDIVFLIKKRAASNYFGNRGRGMMRVEVR